MASAEAFKERPVVCKVILVGKNQAIRGKVTHCIRRAVAPMRMTSESSRRKMATNWGEKRKPSAARISARTAGSWKKRTKASRTRP